MAAAPQFDGVRVHLGARDFLVPPLTLRAVRRFQSMLTNLKELGAREPTDDELDRMLDLVHAALSRNYPEITVDELNDLIDMTSLPIVIKAIVGQSGLEPVKAKEFEPGEPAALQPSIGTTSSQA